MSEPARLIAHLDMDAFYASVELLRYPELRGRPVVIGGGSRHQPEEATDPATGGARRKFATLRDYAGRGVVMTASYEARALGLHSALGLMKAAALAPDTILLPTDFDAYRKYSRLFKTAVRTLAPQIEDRGIDEIYIDLTGVDSPHRGLVGARAGAGRVGSARATSRRTSRRRCALRRGCPARSASRPTSCSRRWRRNWTSRMASRCSLRADIAARIWPLPARKVNGIGPKASAKLEALGIRTIGELARADPAWLVEHFGSNYGPWLHAAAHGRDERPVVTYSEPKSISRETTFEHDL